MTSLVAGPCLLLGELIKKRGIDALLKQCFPEDHKLILSLVYYIIHKGNALYCTESWSVSNLHPFEETITSQRISELLSRLSENARQNFLSLWFDRVRENDWLCYDITSVSSYARHNEYPHYGYNRDDESLAQINLAMLFGQSHRLPGGCVKMRLWPVYKERPPGPPPLQGKARGGDPPLGVPCRAHPSAVFTYNFAGHGTRINT